MLQKIHIHTLGGKGEGALGIRQVRNNFHLINLPSTIHTTVQTKTFPHLCGIHQSIHSFGGSNIARATTDGKATQTHILKTAVDPRDGPVLLSLEADVFGLVVLADKVHHGIRAPDSGLHALLVIRAFVFEGRGREGETTQGVKYGREKA